MLTGDLHSPNNETKKVMEDKHHAPMKGEGRLTDALLNEKLRRGKGPLVGGKTKSGKPKRDIHWGLR
jgi:hypothetical protein